MNPSISNLIQIQYLFTHIKNIGHISSQECILPKSYDDSFPQNIIGINDICNKFPHIEKNWTDFNGGNIFWISKKVIDENLSEQFCKYLEKNFSNEKPDSNLLNQNIMIEYLCERLFTGNFCFNRTNILFNNLKGTNNGYNIKHGKVINSNIYQPKIFSIYKPKEVIDIFKN